MEENPKPDVFWASTAARDHATYSKTQSRRKKRGTPLESRATLGLLRSPPKHDRNGGERKKTEPKGTKGWRWWLGGFRSRQDKRKRKGREGMRVGHTARSDHSGHDLLHTEVRVCRVATSKKNKGSEEEVGGGARAKEGEKNGCRRCTHEHFV